MSNRYDLFDFLEKFDMFLNIQTLEYLSFDTKLFKLNNAKISPERNRESYVNTYRMTTISLLDDDGPQNHSS